MMVSVSGYNYSGSSAVIDLLREYDNTKVILEEIGLIYLPDGILDLEYNMNLGPTYFNGDVAIRRYKLFSEQSIPHGYRKEFKKINKKYIERLVETNWYGNSCFDCSRMERRQLLGYRVKWLYSVLKWHFFHKSSNVNCRKMYLACYNNNFKEITADFLYSVGKMFGEEEGYINVYNQWFSAYCPERCMKYTEDSKCIVVNRDPRDVYILGKIKKETHCYPTDNVEKFVAYYKRCWKIQKNSDRVLNINFEDLIYNYKDTVKIIEEFLGLTQHVNEKKYFNPDISISNTQLKNRFPELKDDIEYIEAELKDYLYVFQKDIEINGDFF